MNRHQLSEDNQFLKEEKDKLKKIIKEKNERNNTKKTQINSVQFIFPNIEYKPNLTDRVFQWYFNGFIVDFDGKLLIVDPGADFYTRFSKMDLDLNDVAALFISHEHIDHTASLPVLVDMLLRLGKPIDLIMPEACLKTRLPAYLAEEITSGKTRVNLVLLSEQHHLIPQEVHLSPLQTMKIIPLFHTSPQTYGFTIEIDKSVVAYISDTGYATEIITDEGEFRPGEAKGKFKQIKSKHLSIKNAYQHSTHAVVNINDIAYSRHASAHLTAWDVIDIFDNSSLRQLYLQHQYPYNVRGADNSKSFCEFFEGEDYEVDMPFGEIKRVL